MTELFFCNVCQQSVPQISLDTGNAVRHGDRVICPDCADTLVIATELEPSKREWSISPIVIVFFTITWAVFAYMYVEQQRFFDAVTASNKEAVSNNNRLSAANTRLERALENKIGDSATRAKIERDKLTSVIENGDNKLRDALSRQANALAEFESLPSQFSAMSSKLNLSQIEISTIADSAREIRAGQLVLRDKISAVERQVAAAPTPVDVEESFFDSRVQSILQDLESSDPNTRFAALEDIADHNDPNLVPYVAPLLYDSYEFCRYQAATTLRQWSALSATPQLIEALDDTFEFVRKEVNAALEAVTKNSVGYNHKDDDAARAASQQAWRDWWKNNG
ncbi:MAG: HEAT repeat domain-containing protein [Planctomycetota bacterium]|nr:HEAT repeat domain-containing protein [Planctomycetota bacterium]